MSRYYQVPSVPERGWTCYSDLNYLNPAAHACLIPLEPPHNVIQALKLPANLQFS
jgi:hypothetical protein